MGAMWNSYQGCVIPSLKCFHSPLCFQFWTSSALVGLEVKMKRSFVFLEVNYGMFSPALRRSDGISILSISVILKIGL